MSLAYNEVNWVHYLTRPKEFLFSNVLVKRFKGSELKKVVGSGYDHWLFLNKGENTMALYYRKEEIETVDKTFQQLIKNEAKLRQLFERGKEEIKKTQEMISLYKESPPLLTSLSKLSNEYEKTVQQLVDYFVYAVEIPYCIGQALEKSGLTTKQEYAWILKQCEAFRLSSLYPDFNEFVVGKLYSAIAQLAGVTKEDLLLNTADEVQLFLQGKLAKEQLVANADKRKNAIICYAEFGKEQFVDDSMFLHSFYSAVNMELKEVKGSVAQKGLVRGRAKVVISKEEFGKFQEGDILVTIQSNPVFMPILAKCAAIVADEGGIMSHAAIVSRELKKPCIIGTKVATKTFKDGDLIEVDAISGVVRKLK